MRSWLSARMALPIALTVAGVAASGQTDNTGAPIRVSGSTTVFAGVFEKNEAAISKRASTEIAVIGNGSRQGLSDLIAGRSDIAMVSASLEEVLAHMTPAERSSNAAANLVVTPLGGSRLLFIVNASNPVEKLTLKQVADLFTGASTNWKQVGGPDLAVTVVSNQFSSGQRAVLEDKVTKGKLVSDSARWVVNDSLIPGIVRQVKGALGHAGEHNDLHGVKVLVTTEPVIQPMSLVTRGTPAGRIARVIAAAKAMAVRH